METNMKTKQVKCQCPKACLYHAQPEMQAKVVFEHAPTPWQIGTPQNAPFDSYLVLIGKDGQLVKLNEYNAEFIVRAVNEYEANVKTIYEQAELICELRKESKVAVNSHEAMINVMFLVKKFLDSDITNKENQDALKLIVKQAEGL